MATVAFIGLGNMGAPMAGNIVRKGHDVVGFDVSPANAEAAKARGIRTASSVAEAVSGAAAVVTCLPNGVIARAVYLGDDGVLAAAAPGTVSMDASTIDVESARAIHAGADHHGLLHVDAPMSGGVGGAEAGTLTFMVGGTEKAWDAAVPYLQCMGVNIVHAGGPGNGEAAKICNNMILGISMIGVSEAFVLAEKLGLDAQKLFDISSKASGRCWSLDTYCPVPGPVPASPANRDYKPGFAVNLMLKDLKLSQEAAQQAGAATPMGAQATALYGLMAAGGNGGLDFSGIVKFIRGDV